MSDQAKARAEAVAAKLLPGRSQTWVYGNPFKGRGESRSRGRVRSEIAKALATFAAQELRAAASAFDLQAVGADTGGLPDLGKAEEIVADQLRARADALDPPSC